MPNGVICGGAVDGSNQVGAMVTCHAITTSPAGVCWAMAGAAAPKISAAATIHTSGTFEVMDTLQRAPARWPRLTEAVETGDVVAGDLAPDALGYPREVLVERLQRVRPDAVRVRI